MARNKLARAIAATSLLFGWSGLNAATSCDFVAVTSCTLTEIRCVGPGEEYDTTRDNSDNPTTHAEFAFNRAASDAQPGDTIKVKGGTYTHQSDSPEKDFWTINSSGTALQPIRIEPFDGETVILEGEGFVDCPNFVAPFDPLSTEEGVCSPENATFSNADDENVVYIGGDHVHFRNFEITNSGRYGLRVESSYGVYEYLSVHDSWDSNIQINAQGPKDLSGANDLVGNTFRYIEIYSSRHKPGFWIVPNFARIRDTLIEYAMFYRNGYQADPMGGVRPAPLAGDADGIQSVKNCHDLVHADGEDPDWDIYENMCPNTIIRNSLAFNNADDGFDTSAAVGSKHIDNISFNNGPLGNKGYKQFTEIVGGASFIGNVGMGQSSFSFELPFLGAGELHHSTAVNNDSAGLDMFVASAVAGEAVYKNNLSAFNGGSNDLRLGSTGAAIESGGNFHEDDAQNGEPQNQGDPGIIDESLTDITVDTTFPMGATIPEKIDFIRDQFVAAYSPGAGSPLINNGVIDADVHCATADNGMPAHPSWDKDCRHYWDTLPDIGSFESGLPVIRASNPAGTATAVITAPPSVPVLSVAP